MFGKGDGTFTAATNYPVGPNPTAIIIGDFNDDSKPDLVVANPNNIASPTPGNSISLLLNTGRGSFGPRTDIPVGDGPYALAKGDFNKDGKLDLAVTLVGSNYQGKTVAVLLGDGAGFFTALNTFTVESGPTAITAADFNGDNKLDLAVASLFLNEVSLLLGDGTGSFAPPTTFGVGDQPNSLVVGDFNRDGKKDLAVAAGNYGNIAILPGNGAGGFGSERHVNMGQDVSLLTSAVLANVTVDSKLDLVALATVEK